MYSLGYLLGVFLSMWFLTYPLVFLTLILSKSVAVKSSDRPYKMSCLFDNILKVHSLNLPDELVGALVMCISLLDMILITGEATAYIEDSSYIPFSKTLELVNLVSTGLSPVLTIVAAMMLIPLTVYTVIQLHKSIKRRSR